MVPQRSHQNQEVGVSTAIERWAPFRFRGCPDSVRAPETVSVWFRLTRRVRLRCVLTLWGRNSPSAFPWFSSPGISHVTRQLFRVPAVGLVGCWVLGVRVSVCVFGRNVTEALLCHPLHISQVAHEMRLTHFRCWSFRSLE